MGGNKTIVALRMLRLRYSDLGEVSARLLEFCWFSKLGMLDQSLLLAC